MTVLVGPDVLFMTGLFLWCMLCMPHPEEEEVFTTTNVATGTAVPTAVAVPVGASDDESSTPMMVVVDGVPVDAHDHEDGVLVYNNNNVVRGVVPTWSQTRSSAIAREA